MPTKLLLFSISLATLTGCGSTSAPGTAAAHGVMRVTPIKVARKTLVRITEHAAASRQ